MTQVLTENPPAPGHRLESYCPHCGTPLEGLLIQLAQQGAPPAGVGLACPGCLEGLISSGLPFANKLSRITAPAAVINQSARIREAILRARPR